MSSRTINLDDRLYDYMLSISLRDKELLKRLREETSHLPMARMQISPEQGQLMGLLVKLLNARRAIEVGVFTGYSALSVAMALPEDGLIIACDVSEEWTKMASRYWKEAAVSHKIDLRLAPALETLDQLIAQKQENSFDFAFIDADKDNYDHYYERCLKLLQPGGLLTIDNVLWGGSVADPTINDIDTAAIRQLNQKIHQDNRVDMSLVPIGDGLMLVRKR